MQINWGVVLSAASLLLSVGASIGYAFAGDLKRAVYWFAAIWIVWSVTDWKFHV